MKFASKIVPCLWFVSLQVMCDTQQELQMKKLDIAALQRAHTGA